MKISVGIQSSKLCWIYTKIEISKVKLKEENYSPLFFCGKNFWNSKKRNPLKTPTRKKQRQKTKKKDQGVQQAKLRGSERAVEQSEGRNAKR